MGQLKTMGNRAKSTPRRGKTVRLRPAPARPWLRVRVPKALNGGQRKRLLQAMLTAASFDEACLSADVPRGVALAARRADAAFAAQGDDVMAMRIAEVEARLADIALLGLRRALEPGEDGRPAVALGQWLVDARRSGGGKQARTTPRRRGTRKLATGKLDGMLRRVCEVEQAALKSR